MEKKKSKFIEFGRSMIEIVGALAIMGAISVGSVLGLRYAFDKQQSNEIISELAQQAIFISSLKEHNKMANLDDLKNSALAKKYDMSYNYTEQEGFFSITLSNVPDEVVRELIALRWNLPYNVYINGDQIYDYNIQSKKEKHSGLLTSIFIKSAIANDGQNTIKFVFQNQLDETIKPDYIDKDTCLATGGKWEETRCFCPTGAIMAATGCITQCGGDTGIECPKEAICFRDSECRGCSEICKNGLCVWDEEDVCNGKPYCDGNKITSCFRTGSKSTACAIHYGKETDCSEKGEGMTCSMENGVAECIQGPLDCGEHGQWDETTLACMCEAGFSGLHCEKQDGYSPCQTYSIQNGKEVREFKPVGTPCEHAGIEGECNQYGRCVPTKGTKCKSISGCSEGYFCNYGGHAGDHQGGGTPDICEVVSTNTFKHNGKLYYYNTASDLKAWCRPADKGKNCTWGFLSYYGAQSWCKSLDAELVDASVIHDNCNVFSVLPSVMGDQQYWVKGQSVVHMGKNCSIQKMSRTDGYAEAAGVLCVTDAEKEVEALTDDEKDFIEEMRQVRQKLGDLNGLKGKKTQADAEKKRYEDKLRELKQAFQQTNDQNIQTKISQFQSKYNVLLYVESQYEKMMPIFERVYNIAVQTLEAADNITPANIRKIRQCKQEYETGNYPQKLLDIMGLGEILSVKPFKRTSSNFGPHILKELFGIKSANASLGGRGVGYCSGLAAYDTAVGTTSMGLEIILDLFGMDTDVCSTAASYLQVGANVDRLIDACGLENVNHIDEKLLKIIESAIKAACKGGCKDDEVFVLGYGCCPKSDTALCECTADSGEYINGTCCKEDKAFWADPIEKCRCEANGDEWIDKDGGHCCPKNSSWNGQKCECTTTDNDKCNCLNDKGSWDDKLGCCKTEDKGGHWDQGICCGKGEHNADGICCKQGQHNANGICCQRFEVNSNDHCCPSSIYASIHLEWNGTECSCPEDKEIIEGPNGDSGCCDKDDKVCACRVSGGNWLPDTEKCCDRKDEKCLCAPDFGYDWDDELGCCQGSGIRKWSNGLCCDIKEHNSSGHCCPNGTEWSFYDSAWYDPFSSDSGSCCPVGTSWNGEECKCENKSKAECDCIAENGVYVDGVCCKQGMPPEKCVCEANGSVWIDE